MTGLFETTRLGDFEVRGATGPVGIHELAGVGHLRGRIDVARARGREAEMTRLEDALARTADGDPQVVGLVAEPGVGKSRLCSEFAERCRARGVELVSGGALAHTAGVPFVTVLEVLREWFGVTDRDSDEDAREKIAGRQGRLAGVVTAIARARADRGAGVIIIEDLHWIDRVSEAIVRTLVAGLPGSRTMIVLNFRPEYDDRWAHGARYQRIRVAPLGTAAATALPD